LRCLCRVSGRELFLKLPEYGRVCLTKYGKKLLAGRGIGQAQDFLHRKILRIFPHAIASSRNA